MLTRLLFKHQSIYQLSLAVVGSLCGLLIMLSSLQAYFDFKNLFSKSTDLINPQYIIVNKKVSLLNTLSFAHNGFSQDEIENFKKVKTVEHVGTFTSNHFTAQAYVEKNNDVNIPGFYTELFFESVPDEFIDVKSDKWKWTIGDSVVPMIIPADYLNLYNFGFAPSQNLPQISKKTIEAATFNLKIQGNDSVAFIHAHIVGFSDRINSFLVPQNFLDESNNKLSLNKIKNPSRLIVVSNDPSSPDLMKFLNDNGYETSSENLKNSKLSLVLRIIMNIMVGIGIMIILLSLLGFIQYSQLMISRSKYEIQTLIHLGFYHFTISKKYIVFYFLLFTSILIVTFGILAILKSKFVLYMKQNGFEVDENISTGVIISGIGIFLFLMFVNIFSIYRNVITLAKPM